MMIIISPGMVIKLKIINKPRPSPNVLISEPKTPGKIFGLTTPDNFRISGVVLVEVDFKVHRTFVTEGAVEPLAVVEDFQPLEDRRLKRGQS